MDDEELPDDKMLEYDDETLELTLPSGDGTLITTCFMQNCQTDAEKEKSKPRVWKQPAAGSLRFLL